MQYVRPAGPLRNWLGRCRCGRCRCAQRCHILLVAKSRYRCWQTTRCWIAHYTSKPVVRTPHYNQHRTRTGAVLWTGSRVRVTRAMVSEFDVLSVLTSGIYFSRIAACLSDAEQMHLISACKAMYNVRDDLLPYVYLRQPHQALHTIPTAVLLHCCFHSCFCGNYRDIDRLHITSYTCFWLMEESLADYLPLA